MASVWPEAVKTYKCFLILWLNMIFADIICHLYSVNEYIEVRRHQGKNESRRTKRVHMERNSFKLAGWHNQTRPQFHFLSRIFMLEFISSSLSVQSNDSYNPWAKNKHFRDFPLSTHIIECSFFYSILKYTEPTVDGKCYYIW
jgi:hypothetical protein